MFRNGSMGNKYQRALEFYHIPNTDFPNLGIPSLQRDVDGKSYGLNNVDCSTKSHIICFKMNSLQIRALGSILKVGGPTLVKFLEEFLKKCPNFIRTIDRHRMT